MTPTIHILLPVHNRREITARFLQCLRRQTTARHHLLLLDDGSTDGTAEMAREIIPDLTVIRGNGDWWWAGALDAGVRWLQANDADPGDIVLMINDDTTFDAEFLQIAADFLSTRERTLLLAEAYSQSRGVHLPSGIHAEWRRMSFEPARTQAEINCLSTMGLFLRVRDLAVIGGFHPRLLPHFLSDYEFTMRAHEKGFALTTTPELRLSVNEETTWSRSPDKRFWPFVRAIFSNRFPDNPLSWTAFIALRCPWRWKFVNWCRVWAAVVLLILFPSRRASYAEPNRC